MIMGRRSFLLALVIGAAAAHRPMPYGEQPA